jgi:murein DD-endopeptidase MepM/ murein hydrolase activator NlpD
MWCIAILSIAFCTFFGFLVREYLHLKSIAREAEALESQLADQRELLQFQRQQIRDFAGEIHSLKDKVASLSQFGRKVRSMVELDGEAGDENLSGVGGSAPADLDACLDLEVRQSALLSRLQTQVTRLNQEAEIQHEKFSTLIGALEERNAILARTPSIYPVQGRMTSRFGPRKSPFTGKTEFHKGIDIAARMGTKVVAPADGRVKMARRNGGYGKMMVIEHGNGVKTRYAHLKKYLKKPGDVVKRGEAIAEIGNTGRSTGPHLHYEVRRDGVPVNPIDYVGGKNRQLASRDQ